MLILRTLQWGPQHGHGIGVALRAHLVRKQGLVEAEWKLSENRQRARYYRLTAKGKKALAIEQSKWNRMVEAIARVMRPAEGE